MSPNPSFVSLRKGPAVKQSIVTPGAQESITVLEMASYAAVVSGQRPSKPSAPAGVAATLPSGGVAGKEDVREESDASKGTVVADGVTTSTEDALESISPKHTEGGLEETSEETHPERVLKPLKSVSELSECLKSLKVAPVAHGSLKEGQSRLEVPKMVEQRPMSKKARSRMRKRLKKLEEAEAAAAPAALVAKDPPQEEKKGSDSVSQLLERGIENRGNSCYANAIIQALLHCGPFYRLLTMLYGIQLPVPCPVTNRLVLLTYSLSHAPVKGAETAEDHLTALRTAFDPYICAGMQQDAHEFLTWLLSSMHDEMRQVIAVMPSTSQKEEEDDDGWSEVGKKNRSTAVNKVAVEPSVVRELFSSTLHSLVRRSGGGGGGTATLEPVLCLPLDLTESVTRLETALDNLMSREALQGQTSIATSIESLPPLLLLQLKRFQYSDTNATKLSHHVAFPFDLRIPKSFLTAAAVRNGEGKNLLYHLLAVVTHTGSNVSRGHYTCDARVESTSSGWLHFDDAFSSYLPAHEVASNQAYILFYARSGFQ